MSQDNAIDGRPVFALNKIMRHQLEISSVQVGGRWVDSFVYTVDGQLVMRFADWYSTTMNLGTYTPGVFLWGGTARVHYVSGHTDPNAADWIPNSLIEPKYLLSDFSGGQVLNTQVHPNAEITQNVYSQNPMASREGRILDRDFLPAERVVYIRRKDTGEYVGTTYSDAEGFYRFDAVETGYEYFVEYLDEHSMLVKAPEADYIGYGELAGAYRIRGENVGAVEVKVYSEETEEFLGQVLTDSNGQFRVSNVNSNHLFTLVFREPSGGWEDHVSSRRIPELEAFNLTFESSLASVGDRITGVLRVKNGHGPYIATAPNLKPGVALAVNDDEISFVGEAVMMGPYSIPITVTSADGGTGLFTLEGRSRLCRQHPVRGHYGNSIARRADRPRRSLLLYEHSESPAVRH